MGNIDFCVLRTVMCPIRGHTHLRFFPSNTLGFQSNLKLFPETPFLWIDSRRLSPTGNLEIYALIIRQNFRQGNVIAPDFLERV